MTSCRWPLAGLAILVSAPAFAAALLTGITPVLSNGAASTLIVKQSAGTAFSVVATSFSATSAWLVGYNATSVPADGALSPTLVNDCVALPANGTASISSTLGQGTNYTVGIVYIVTTASSCYTKTTGVATAFIKALAQ